MNQLEVPYGFIKGDDLYLSSWGDQSERKIGEIKEDGSQVAIAYFQMKFLEFKKKIDELIITVNSSENKGSYLMKLLHLKEKVLVHDGLGDYAALKDVLQKYEDLLTELIQKNRERNTEIKTALLNEMKEAVEIVNWNKSTEKVQDVKARWLKTGNARKSLQGTLEQEFWGIVEDFFERKKEFYEDKRQLTKLRKAQYMEIINQTDEVQSLKGKERFDKVKALKAAWSKIGNIPESDYRDLEFKFNSILKGSNQASPPDFDGIKTELDQMFVRTHQVDKSVLQRYRKNISSFKTRNRQLNEKRHELMQLINMVWERDFIENLAKKKFKGFNQKEESEKNQLLSRLLREFLHRDKEDLKQYEENSEKFAGHDQNINIMLKRKLGQQLNKITVKEKLLEIWTGSKE